MADQPTQILIYDAKGFSLAVHDLSTYPTIKEEEAKPFSLRTEMEAFIAKEEKRPLTGEEKKRFDQEDKESKEVTHRLDPLSAKLRMEEGRTEILKHFGIDEKTPDDFRLVFCQSAAGNVCFKAKETKDGLVLGESLPLENSLTYLEAASVIASQDKAFKMVPGQKLLSENELGEVRPGFNGGFLFNLTPQGEKNLLPVIQNVVLADKALHSQYMGGMTAGTVASLPHNTMSAGDFSRPPGRPR